MEKIGPGKIDDGIRRITRDEDLWILVEDPVTEDDISVIQAGRNEAIGI
jgi:hypothetical protein